jgi:hypothetical protein
VPADRDTISEPFDEVWTAEQVMAFLSEPGEFSKSKDGPEGVSPP